MVKLYLLNMDIFIKSAKIHIKEKGRHTWQRKEKKEKKHRKTLNTKPEGNGPFANPCLNFILTRKLPFSFPLCCPPTS